MAAGSMAIHLMTQHWWMEEAQRIWRNPSIREGQRTFRMALLAKGGLRRLLVEGCRGRASMSMAMQVHFLHQHVLDIVVILEEGNLPHPQCT